MRVASRAQSVTGIYQMYLVRTAISIKVDTLPVLFPCDPRHLEVREQKEERLWGPEDKSTRLEGVVIEMWVPWGLESSKRLGTVRISQML